MHMSDALVSPAVAITAGAVSVALLVIASRKVKRERNDKIIPLMGVMGAFIFAAQMINFTIPGTGSSGHIIGGLLLAAILGPWAGLLVVASVLLIQCLVFADGGLMALGCNILNMGVTSCLVAYPLIFKPIMRYPASWGRLFTASLTACVAALELGALAVTLETEASGVTPLPVGQFLLFMLPIHLLIGAGEGVATAAILYFVQQYKPELLVEFRHTLPDRRTNCHWGKALIVFGLIAGFFAIGFKWIASSNPDGLEWSIWHTLGGGEIAQTNTMQSVAGEIQKTTALMPDYGSSLSGIVGALLVLLLTWGLSSLLKRRRRAHFDEDE